MYNNDFTGGSPAYARRDEALAKARAIIDGAVQEGRDHLTKSEEQRFESALERAESLESGGRYSSAPSPARDAGGRADADSGRLQMANIQTGGSPDPFERFIRGSMSEAEYRAEARDAQQTVGSSGAGGVVVPQDFREQLFDVLDDHGGMRRTRATNIRTNHGRDIQVPTIDDVSNQAELVSEGSTISGTTSLSFSDTVLEAAMYQAGPVTVTRELLQDAEIDIVGLVQEKLAERISRATEAHYATRSSTESSGPHGIVNFSTGAVGVSGGSSNLSYTDLYDLKHSVDRAYRTNAEWSMSDNTFLEISKLQDNNGQFLLEPRQTENASQMLLGHPVRINNNLDDFGSTGNKAVWFGDFSAYAIRDVNTVAVQRLDERFALERRVGFLGWFRTAGRCTQAPSRPPTGRLGASFRRRNRAHSWARRVPVAARRRGRDLQPSVLPACRSRPTAIELTEGVPVPRGPGRSEVSGWAPSVGSNGGAALRETCGGRSGEATPHLHLYWVQGRRVWSSTDGLVSTVIFGGSSKGLAWGGKLCRTIM